MINCIIIVLNTFDNTCLCNHGKIQISVYLNILKYQVNNVGVLDMDVLSQSTST